MNREKMLQMLHAFDKELDRPMTIVITGASALIIRGCIIRVSKDIDVLQASDDLESGHVKKIIQKLATKFALDNEWINNRAKMIFEDLPGYKPDLIPVDGTFKHLKPYIISLADSVITKFAHFTNIRQWDKSDIATAKFGEQDFKDIRKKLDILYMQNPERSLRIELAFKSVKPEFIKTAEGYRYSNSTEVAEYALKRYGIVLEESTKKQIDEDVLNMVLSYEKAIVDIDYRALEELLRTKKPEC